MLFSLIYLLFYFCKFRQDFVGTITSLSIGGVSSAADRAVGELWDLGAVTVAASGNEAVDSCYSTFCRDQDAICVGAHEYDVNTCVKKMSSFSNYGACVDIMAPGNDILSASYTDNNGK